MQQAVQAAAASAVTVAAPAILLELLSLVAQPQPGEFSVGRAQAGPITLM
jgi:hypothetical protein